MLPAGAAFRRARANHRAVIASGVLIGLLAAGTWVTAVPAAQRAQSAYWLARVPVSQLTPLSALPAATQARVRIGARGAREAARHAPAASAAAVAGYTLLGLAFVSTPLWAIAGTAAIVAVAQSVFAGAFRASGAVTPWTPAVVLLAVGLVALAVRGRYDDRVLR